MPLLKAMVWAFEKQVFPSLPTLIKVLTIFLHKNIDFPTKSYRLVNWEILVQKFLNQYLPGGDTANLSRVQPSFGLVFEVKREQP